MSDGPLNVAGDELRVAIRLSPRVRTDRLVAVATSPARSTSRNEVVRGVGDPQRLVAQVAPEIARLPGG